MALVGSSTSRHDYPPPVTQVFLLALAAALNPTLVAASTLMMLLPNPKRLMLGYLLGALMTSITLTTFTGSTVLILAGAFG